MGSTALHPSRALRCLSRVVLQAQAVTYPVACDLPLFPPHGRGGVSEVAGLSKQDQTPSNVCLSL